MPEKKTILMLGGSAQQVPAIKRASEMGYRTVVIDYLPDNPGRLIADKWYQESTTDLKAVKHIAETEKADGILAYASDPAALPAAIVSEELGLPTNPAHAIKILGVKHEFRNFLKKNGFPSPETYIFSPSDSLEEIKSGLSSLRFPIVIKPTDSSGSKGVSFLNDLTNLQRAVKHAGAYSRNKILIAEEYIERGFPNVIGGDVFVADGEIKIFGNMACLRDENGENLIPVGKKYPDGLNTQATARLFDELQKIISRLGLISGELNIEVIVDHNDDPHFLEIGPRAGGNMIPIQLSDIFGIDLIEANIKAAMGEPLTLNPQKPDACYMTHVLHSYQKGYLDKIEFSDQIERYIYRKAIYKQEGDEIEYFDGAGKALGIIFMKFPDHSTLNEIYENISNHIHILLK